MDDLFSVKGKVCVVTGSCGVLGGAMARGLAARGAKVVITGTKKDECDATSKDIVDSGFESIGIEADVTKEDDLQRMRAVILEKWGKINVLINAAGGNMPGATVPPHSSFFDVPIDDVRKVMDVNFIGTVLPCLVFGKAIEQGEEGGVIINISSMAAEKATITRVMGYSASKAAVSNLTRWLATELGKKHGEKVRVNALAPGFFLGDQNRALLMNEDGTLTARGNKIIEGTPFGRFGKPEELLGPVVWLCSDASKFITGAIIPIDGGFSSFSGV